MYLNFPLLSALFDYSDYVIYGLSDKDKINSNHFFHSRQNVKAKQ